MNRYRAQVGQNFEGRVLRNDQDVSVLLAKTVSFDDAVTIAAVLNQSAGAVEALRELADRCRDLDALIGPQQDSGIYPAWKRAIDAADAIGGQ
jgi:hypothetical protein